MDSSTRQKNSQSARQVSTNEDNPEKPNLNDMKKRYKSANRKFWICKLLLGLSLFSFGLYCNIQYTIRGINTRSFESVYSRLSSEVLGGYLSFIDYHSSFIFSMNMVFYIKGSILMILGWRVGHIILTIASVMTALTIDNPLAFSLNYTFRLKCIYVLFHAVIISGIWILYERKLQLEQYKKRIQQDIQNKDKKE